MADSFLLLNVTRIFVGSPDRVIGEDESTFMVEKFPGSIEYWLKKTEFDVAEAFSSQKKRMGVHSTVVADTPDIRPGDMLLTSSTYPSRNLRLIIQNPGVTVWSYGMDSLGWVRGEYPSPPSDGQIAVELGLIQQILADYDASQTE